MDTKESFEASAESEVAAPRSTDRLAAIGNALSLVRDYGIIVSVILLFVVLALASDVFLSLTNAQNILDQWAALGIIAIGQTLVIIGGGFDLSVGAVFALAGVIGATVASSEGVIIGLLAALLVSSICGAINGVLATVGRVNPLIATLSTSIMFRGAALALSGGLLVAVRTDEFTELGRGDFVGFKYSVWIFAAVFVICAAVLSFGKYGVRLYASGSNEEAARHSGVNVTRVRIIAYTVSGLLAGLAGMIVASRAASGQADVGVGFELIAIAAVAIGGTSIFGGQGALWRTVLGIFLLAFIRNGFNLLEVEPTLQQIFQGAIIVLAVMVDAWARAVGRRH